MTTWLPPVESELDNLRAALGWSIGEGRDVALGVAIIVAQYLVLEPLSLAREGFRWTELALAAYPGDLPSIFEAPLKFALAKYYIREGYIERSIEPAMRSVALYRELSEHRRCATSGHANALHILSLSWVLRSRRSDDAMRPTGLPRRP